jgi:hypothetical protein
MSDLNQAIREHLALKRQHGADPGEVARLEREAFGDLLSEAQIDYVTAYAPEFDAAMAVEAEPEPSVREEFVPRTNEHAAASLRAYLEGGEATQEYTIEERIGWSAGPAWHGGAA